jgi:hypothetical protein
VLPDVLDRIAQGLMDVPQWAFVEPPPVLGDRDQNHRIQNLWRGMKEWSKGNGGIKIFSFQDLMKGESELSAISSGCENSSFSSFYHELLADAVRDWVEQIEGY